MNVVILTLLVLECSIAVQACVQHDFLKAHNLVRRYEKAANMKKMIWSDDLADLAENWARECIKGHSDKSLRKTKKFKKVGENIHRSTRKKTGLAAVSSWYKEKSFYNFKKNKCSGVCGHYTQVVWATSEYVGCAVAYCPRFFKGRGGYNYVCNYGPRGNWRRKKPYIPGLQCSRCPRGYTCQKGLCAKKS
ncbi:GLIPR1-like protein 1 [Ostrea edulis]|uniref:GLIPR1-like protein 1 n=1 Tax=Ostrea edulis TaxID=37623 RepID=UPI0020958AC8|nr:GLIPR1-like protein 1 [Ostrea edulis]